VVAAAEKLADATVRVEEIKSYYWWDDKASNNWGCYRTFAI
jgi:uncharacterized protein involved in tolerance to divalent cations